MADGREPSPSTGSIDSLSVKETEVGVPRRYDGTFALQVLSQL